MEVDVPGGDDRGDGYRVGVVQVADLLAGEPASAPPQVAVLRWVVDYWVVDYWVCPRPGVGWGGHLSSVHSAVEQDVQQWDDFASH